MPAARLTVAEVALFNTQARRHEEQIGFEETSSWLRGFVLRSTAFLHRHFAEVAPFSTEAQSHREVLAFEPVLSKAFFVSSGLGVESKPFTQSLR
jgi:hypothetical protein